VSEWPLAAKASIPYSHELRNATKDIKCVVVGNQLERHLQTEDNGYDSKESKLSNNLVWTSYQEPK
jgi:hypothetical protein